MRTGLFAASVVLAVVCGQAEGVRPEEPENVPELMRSFAGEEIATRSQWERVRRPELLKTFQGEEYGVRPVERPADLAFEETAPVEDCFGGRAIRKRVRATYSGPGGREKIDFSVWIPKREKPVAVFVHSSPRPAETANFGVPRTRGSTRSPSRSARTAAAIRLRKRSDSARRSSARTAST